MKKAHLVILLASLAIGVAIILLILLPSQISKENSVEVTAVVTKILKNKQGDLTLSLQNKRGIFYFPEEEIERIDTDSLLNILSNKEVIIYYQKPHFLSGLSPQTDTRRIRELRLRGEVIFSDWKNE